MGLLIDKETKEILKEFLQILRRVEDLLKKNRIIIEIEDKK